MGRSSANPRARRTRVLEEVVDDEVVVYDLDNDYAHLLNRTSAAVWRRSDGRTSVAAIAVTVSVDLGEEIDEVVVLDALAQLERVGLLERPVATTPGLSRRQMLKTIGIAAAAIPVVTTVLAPTPAAAASSGAAIGAACSSAQNTGNCGCASGNCRKGQAGTGDWCTNSGADCFCRACNSPPTTGGVTNTCPGKNAVAGAGNNPATLGALCTSGPTGSTCNTTTGNCN